MSTTKILDVCYFKVPVEIKDDTEGNPIANFKEVEMKDLCYKIEELETTSSQEAMAMASKLSTLNNQELKLAAKCNKDGDIITRITICDHNKITINTNLI